MRIESFHVDGFGILRDLSHRSVPPGLSVIRGDNEAGKTTLLAFLRHTLFGFPDGRTNEKQYPPLRGGRHGGRVTVLTRNDDSYVVERRPGKGAGDVTVSLPGGGTGDASVLQQLLGFASRELFLNVFAFSLSELQRFESLDDEAVRSAIYSAGMGTGNVSLPDVDAALEKEMGDIFKRRGQNPVMNRILKELEEVQQELRRRRDSVEEFDRLHAELEEVQDRIDGLEQQREAAARRRDRARRLLDAWEDWVDLQSLRGELEELPDVESFPEQGLKRLERLEERQQGLREEIEELTEEKKRCDEKLENLAVNEDVLERADDIGALQRGRDRFDSAVRDLPRRRQELEQARERLEENLRELGPGWDGEKAEQFDASVPQRDAVRQLRDRLKGAETAVTAARSRPALQDEAPETRLPVWPAWAAAALGLALGGIIVAAGSVPAGAATALVLGGGAAGVYLALRHQLRLRRGREREEARQRLQEAEERLSALRDEWTDWLRSAGLPDDVSPESALEMISLITQCRDRRGNIRGLEERVAEMKETVEEYRQRAAQAATQCGLSDYDPEQAGPLVDRLAGLLEEAREARAKRENLQEQRSGLESRLEQRGRRGDELKEQKAELLERAGAEDAEEFRRLAAAWQRRREIEEEMGDRERALARISGPGDRLDALKAELEQTTREEQAGAEEQARDEVERLDEQLDEALDLRGRLRQQLEQLETERSSSELRSRREALKESLHEHARRWSVRAVARALLSEARERYEKERQPAVIQSAAGSFELITGGRYPRIVAPPGQATLDVLDHRDERKSMDELSRGTREQLYFAVRLGLIREFSRRQEPLPVVMDDVFVNFDPDRAAAAMRAVLDLADDHQVLLFTCHPETCELVRSEDSSVPVFRLRDGDILPGTD